MAENNLQEYTDKVLAFIKESPEKVKEFASNNELVKSVVGEDGKLTAEDFDRISDQVKAEFDKTVNEVKESGFVKNLVGEDGKFDGEDVKRLANDAKEAVSGLADKVTGFFKGEE